MSKTDKTEEPQQPKPYVDPSLMQDNDGDKLSAELAETKDKLLRAMAEVENQRRRFERDLKDTATYSVTKFATDMLGIADNLRRALEASPPEIRDDKIAAPLLEGVEITERALLQALGKHLCEFWDRRPIPSIGGGGMFGCTDRHQFPLCRIGLPNL